MPFKRIIVFSLLVCAGFFAVRADIAPDPGYTRVSLRLEVEPQDDFADYRFFLESAIDVKEIALKKGAPNEIPAQGGGAAYSAGTFWALPKKNLAGFGADWRELKKALDENRIEGAVELFKHNFSRTVPDAEAKKQKGARYRLERGEGGSGIRAIQVREENSVEPNAANLTSPSASGFGWLPTAVAGFLIGLGIFFLGLRLFRKSAA